MPKTSVESTATYEFTDTSATRPVLTRLWFKPLFPLVPRWLAANILSLLSTGSLLVVLALSLAPGTLSPSVTALVFFAMLQVYLAGDHLDGMQAVASGTASPLGDFVDHYCDLWAGCILVFGTWSLAGATSVRVLMGTTVLLIAAFATTYAEREAQHKLHFARLGALEANLIVSAFFLSWTFPPIRGWWQSPSPLGFPWYLVIFGVGAGMAVGTIVVIARRMRGLTMPLVAALTGLIALALFVSARAELRPVEGWLLLVLFGGRYVALVMHGYLVPGKRSWPDPVAITAAIVLFAWNIVIGMRSESVRPIAALLGGYLAATSLLTLVRLFSGLRRYWVWVNRPARDAHESGVIGAA